MDKAVQGLDEFPPAAREARPADLSEQEDHPDT